MLFLFTAGTCWVRGMGLLLVNSACLSVCMFGVVNFFFHHFNKIPLISVPLALYLTYLISTSIQNLEKLAKSRNRWQNRMD